MYSHPTRYKDVPGIPLKAVYMNRRSKLVKAQNTLAMLSGSKVFLSTVFEGKDGVYYDAVGDEFLIVKCIGTAPFDGGTVPVYEADFGDGYKVKGMIKDHGFNEYLGAL